MSKPIRVLLDGRVTRARLTWEAEEWPSPSCWRMIIRWFAGECKPSWKPNRISPWSARRVDGLETIRQVERAQPDVLVLDLMMPGLSGLEVLRSIRQRSPRTCVVVLSMQGNNAFVVTALTNGATGYVLKGSEEKNLVHAVREAVAGRRFLSPPLTERAIDAYIEQARAAAIDPHETLTEREREVLQLAAEGRTGGEIAACLHISQRTVENHRANVMRKLGLKNQSELVRYAVRRGIIPLDE